MNERLSAGRGASGHFFRQSFAPFAGPAWGMMVAGSGGREVAGDLAADLPGGSHVILTKDLAETMRNLFCSVLRTVEQLIWNASRHSGT